MRISDHHIDSKCEQQYIDEKVKILEQFGVVVTPAIRYKIHELYPREIAIENYIRQLVFDRLS